MHGTRSHRSGVSLRIAIASALALLAGVLLASATAGVSHAEISRATLPGIGVEDFGSAPLSAPERGPLLLAALGVIGLAAVPLRSAR